ncbi:hypothetical protein ABPG77_010530 [Micractinium sp. CCAP 211/92]
MPGTICAAGQPAQCRPAPVQQRGQAQVQQRVSAAPQALVTSRREWLAGLAAVTVAAAAPRPATATGLESIELPAVATPDVVAQIKARNQQVLDDAEASFQNSELLRTLKERSEANRAERKKALEERYCMRQAELGVGDCGGLRLIPGMTKSGVQKRPGWLDSILGLGSE